MFNEFFSKIIATGIVLTSFIGGLFSSSVQQIQPVNDQLESRVSVLESRPIFGATIPTPVASFSTSLSAKISSTETSMTLVSTSTNDGTSLTNGAVYGFVIDANTASEEYVLGTVSSSNIISMTRGVSVITGNTSVAALKKEHRRGASVKIADAPVLLVLARIINGNETIPNLLTYSTSSATSTINSNILNLANVGYVNSVASSGAADATESVKGLVELATIAETQAGSATGSTAALLVPQNKYFNATSSATTTIVVTQSNGFISPTFISTSSDYVWGGTNTYNGQTIFNSTTTFAGVSGTLTNVSHLQVFTVSSTWTVPTTTTRIFISGIGPGGGGGGGSTGVGGGGGGGSGSYIFRFPTSTTPGSSITITIGSPGAGGVASSTSGSAGTPTTIGSFITLNGGSGGVLGGAGGGATSTVLFGTTLTGTSASGTAGGINDGGRGANLNGVWWCLGGAGGTGGSPANGATSTIGYGCGGGGGNNNAGTGSGAAGGSSVVYIEYN